MRGGKALQAAFSSHIIANKIAEPEKIRVRGREVLFYHSAYLAFLKKVLEKEIDAFCHHNDYAAAFLAGLFDANGGIFEDNVFFAKFDKKDEAVLRGLEFRVEKKNNVLWVGPKDLFLKFVKNWRRVGDDELEGKKALKN
ncbi:MAG: hypothetical protein ABIH83_04745 [Candidatus Micrarchaeota archaeon]